MQGPWLRYIAEHREACVRAGLFFFRREHDATGVLKDFTFYDEF
jgi:hypothetical protein